MNVLEIIEAKKQGRELDPADIGFLVDGFTDGSVTRYQMSAFLMAVWFRGMTADETAALTGEVPVVAGRRWLNPDAIRPRDMVRLSFETHQRLIARDEALDEARGFAGIDEQGLSVRFLLDATEANPETVAAFIDRWDLFPLLDQPIRSLSTGEMRRFLIGRALLFNPRLLILDEPCQGLDEIGRASCRERV